MDGDSNNPFDPESLREMWEKLGLGPAPDFSDPAAVIASMQGLLGQMPSNLSAQEAVRDVARKTVATAGPDPTPGLSARNRLQDASRLAQHWLDDATAFKTQSTDVQVWSRAEWVEATLPVWRSITEPIAENLGRAMSGLTATDDVPAEFATLGQMVGPMLAQSAGNMYSLNSGQALGRLAGSVLSGTDVGMPLLPPGPPAFLPTNISEFSKDRETAEDDVLHYLALRECARHRLFENTAWLGPQMVALLRHFASKIEIDLSGIMENLDPEAMAAADMTEMLKLGEAMSGKLFKPTSTPEQTEIADRLQTLLALIEGWVDHVVEEAAAQLLPSVLALSETMRRRRAEGGPLEQVFTELVGLPSRPKLTREAASLWRQLLQSRGKEGRDQVWQHPDLVPTETDLASPGDFLLGGTETDDLDAELQQLLQETDPDTGDES